MYFHYVTLFSLCIVCGQLTHNKSKQGISRKSAAIMSSSTAPAPTPVLPPPILTQEEANSSSPTMSSQSQTSPSMPSSSSSQARHAHGVSDNWSQLSQPPLSASELKKLNEISERQIAEARAFLEASMSNIGSSLDKTLQERARNLHENSKVLARQEKDLGKATEGGWFLWVLYGGQGLMGDSFEEGE